jgi:HD superfamily phosphodiesterase
MEYSAEKLIGEMIDYFGDDKKRINHALNVLDYARKIHKSEGGDLMIVEAAAILHDIGIPESELKYNSSAGNYQEIEGPPIANGILKEFEISSEDIFHICRIIANNHSDKDIDTIEFRIIWDADWLVNIPDERNLEDKERLEHEIEKLFKTETGKIIAKKRFLT